MLWPTGRISVHGFGPASQLLHLAAGAVRAASPSTKIMIHLADGWNAEHMNYFYSNIFISGKLSLSDVDVMGFSFYPFYGTGATLHALQSSLQGIVKKYGKVSPCFDHSAICSTRPSRTSWS